MSKGNQYYSVDPNKEKNRVYFSMTGDINVSDVPNFESDWDWVVGELQSGFTILGDLYKLGALNPEFEALNTKVQGWLMSKGCGKVAQLVGDVSVMSQVNDFAEKSGMREVLRAFNFAETAELWLDSAK